MNNPAKATTEVVPSRRRFLASAIASALGIAVADVLNPADLLAALPGCSTAGDAFVPVTEFLSKGGKLNVSLTVRAGQKNIATIAGQGYQCRAMTIRYYEGQDLNDPAKKWPPNAQLPGPGPTMRMRVGDHVTVKLTNAIKPSDFPKTSTGEYACNVEKEVTPTGPVSLYPGNDKAPSCFHGNNVTNLHYHGMHVTPKKPGDDVMIDVQPIGPETPTGGIFTNMFDIPTPPPPENSQPTTTAPFKMGQAPGTHWYHAHKHGSVALQLLNGMAGAFIVEGEFDDQLEKLIPGLRATEKVMNIQQLGDNIEILAFGTGPTQVLVTCAGGDPMPLVNGQLEPTITMKPGEIQRWRLINATMQQVADMTYRFVGPGGTTTGAPEIRQIAYDGIQLAPERYVDPAFGMSQKFTLAPGNRIDILVKAPATPGPWALAFTQVYPLNGGCPAKQTIPDSNLVRLNVTGSAVSPAMNFPSAADYPAMPGWLQWNESDPRNDTSKWKERVLTFNVDPTNRPAIDGKAFDGTILTRQEVSLDAAEIWTLKNYWNNSIHPYHIHVNPFQVLSVYDPNANEQVTLQAPYNWYDTVAIPAAKSTKDGLVPGVVKIRSRFVDFDGMFVLHCHILDHEDRGMMQEVDIIDPKHPNQPVEMHH